MFTDRVFRPRLWPTLIVAALLPLLLWLGFWQLQRAQEKTDLQALYEAQAGAAAIPLEEALADDTPLAYTRVTVSGEYDAAHQFLIDNRMHQRRVGFEVLTPLARDKGAARVLVNRGWVPLEGNRSQLPDPPAPAGPVTIEGLLRQPVKPPFITAGDSEQTGWPRVIQAALPEVTGAALGQAVVPYVVLLSPEVPGGFVRDWEAVPADFGPDQHYGYAFQWFALAATLAILFGAFSLERRRD